MKIILDMVIIETRKGPVFINDGQIREITFNKDENEVLIDYGGDMPVQNPINEVENVMYVPDCAPEKYQYKGSRLVELEKERSKLVMINRHLCASNDIFKDGIRKINKLTETVNRDVPVSHLLEILNSTESQLNEADRRYIYFSEQLKKE